MTVTVEHLGPATSSPPIPLWFGLEHVPARWGPSVVCIGVFDGVHRGHARLIDHTVAHARRLGMPSALLTFDPHPARVLGIPRDTGTLTTLPTRADLVARRGIDAVAVLPFTPTLAATSPEDFVRDVLVDALGATTVVVGANFTFGARAAGSGETLRHLGARFGFDTDQVELVRTGSERYSSTFVRQCLRRGDVTAAARVLGRPHRIEGHLYDGELVVAPNTALPGPGLYPVDLVTASLPAQHAMLEVTTEDRLFLRSRCAAPNGPGTVSFTPHR